MPMPTRWRRLRRRTTVGGAVLHEPTDETSIDPETGAVTSTQAAEIVLPTGELEGRWNAENLERVARTYWSTMRRFTLGLIHVEYSEGARYVVLIHPRLRLLTFKTPEYEMNRCRGIVRWRIERGLLVSQQGRDGGGYLEIDIERTDDAGAGESHLRVAVEVANYYPALSGISRRIYVQTQSRIHVLACNYFLRRLVRRDLDTSRIGRFALPDSAEETREPVPARERPEGTGPVDDG
jgi:hypothetical protein